MGREVRRVTKDWEHPKDKKGHYKPLYDEPYNVAADEWITNCCLWAKGEHPDQHGEYACKSKYYWDWSGGPPDEKYYRPGFKDEERTHYQMYENTSEGTPISPVMGSAESLARWLTENNASTFAGMTATYEQWLPICRGGWAPSALMVNCVLKSGVEAMSDKP